MMSVAVWLVWQGGGFLEHRRPLTLFLAQLVLNGVWTLLFFGLHGRVVVVAFDYTNTKAALFYVDGLLLVKGTAASSAALSGRRPSPSPRRICR